MSSDFLAGQRTIGRRRPALALLLAAVVAALAMAVAPATSAASYGAMAWGENFYGELGDGTTTNKDVPVAVRGLSGVTAISAGDDHSLALLSNGTVMAWGGNQFGQLGSGTTRNSRVPVIVRGLSGVTAIAAGWGHSLALLSDGTVMAWGRNTSGQLGDGTRTKRDVPVAVSGLSGVTAVSAGEFHSLALLSNGTVMAWGETYLGNDATDQSAVPVPVSGLSGVTAIADASIYSLALLSNGTVMAWGDNQYGELGDGTTTTQPTDIPVAVSGLSGVKAVAAGYYYSLALLSDGTVMAWGSNEEGELGTGNTHDSDVPVAVVGLSGVAGISAGSQSLSYGRPAPPTIVQLSPHKGPAGGGTTVTIHGSSLSEATGVQFGSTAATSFTVTSWDSITAVSPAGTAGTGDVTVTTSGGTSAVSPRDHFRFGPPTVTELSPNSGARAGGGSVTVEGTGFALGTTATRFKLGVTPATGVNCTSTTRCTVLLPAHKPGAVDLRATVGKLTSAKNPAADAFTYI